MNFPLSTDLASSYGPFCLFVLFHPLAKQDDWETDTRLFHAPVDASNVKLKKAGV